MHAARMQSTNVEFMGTKCLQRMWKRPSTAYGWEATGGVRSWVGLDDDEVGGDGDESGGDRYIRRSGDESLIGSDDVRCGT
jgi:hypothetical protein